MNRRRVGVLVCLVLSGVVSVLLSQAADHSDAPMAAALTRQDANIVDLHAFVVGLNLVLALSTNPAIPPSATNYVFPTDVTFEIKIDADADVDTTYDPFGDGGTVLQPSEIKEDVTFRVRFGKDGAARVQVIPAKGVQSKPEVMRVFTGLRDDAFVRFPREGRNMAAIVLEVPLSMIVREQSTLLIWSTSGVEEFEGKHQELTGRALRSMFTEQNFLNSIHPREHGARPDVVIYDTSKPAAYPNGRALGNDVVDLACSLSGECRVFSEPGEGASGPSTNDVPFLDVFPYLAPPHSPPA